jgi:regulator of protease activity HflC (stomatin/prohibitin superfamily)
MENWVIEFFGEYLTTWQSGLNFLFPYFGFMTVRAEVVMSQQMMKLFMDDSSPDTYGAGHIDFNDSSAPVEATAYFTIQDARHAVYGAADVMSALEESLDSAIRTYLGNFSLDEANTLKVQFDIARVLNGETVIGPDGNLLSKVSRLEDAPLYREARDVWGVIIKNIVISDIILDDVQKAIRQKLQEATKSIQVAEKEVERAEFERRKVVIEANASKEAAIINAEGEKASLSAIGDGITEQIKKLVESGMSHDKAVQYLSDRLKWEKVGDKTVIIDSSGSGATSLGVQIAAGMQTIKK